ncbi:MAG: solute-binding protein [Saprospiraceae bacterium]|nr:solute-binding protein [Saprospiraceae bacterium]
MKQIFIFSLLSVLLNPSCKSKIVEDSTPITGKIEIFCDEALQNIIQQQEEIFERNYPKADVQIHYMNEADIIRKFLYDSVETIIISKSLDSSAIKYLDQEKQLHPRIFPFAISAVAFVCSPLSPDSLLQYESILQATTGNGNLSNRKFVIENKSSGIAKFLLESSQADQLSSNFYAMNSLDTVLDFVSKNKDCIGIIDWSRVSDSDDPIAQDYLRKIKIIKISSAGALDKVEYFPPFQYNLQDKIYPFTRTLNIISRTGKSDLGLGFATFITGEIGQKIILKAGLLPIYQSERVIELKSSGDIKVVQ